MYVCIYVQLIKFNVKRWTTHNTNYVCMYVCMNSIFLTHDGTASLDAGDAIKSGDVHHSGPVLVRMLVDLQSNNYITSHTYIPLGSYIHTHTYIRNIETHIHTVHTYINT